MAALPPCSSDNQAPSVNVKGPCEARNQTESPMGDSATCPPAVIPCTTRKKLPTLRPHTPHPLNPVEEARSNPCHFYSWLLAGCWRRGRRGVGGGGEVCVCA